MINGKTGFVKNLVFVESDSTLENAVRAESNIFVVATDLQETFSPFILKKNYQWQHSPHWLTLRRVRLHAD